jgi:hypothetical protein
MHFFITLPVDGQFFSVPVRFIGGKFNESYVPHNRFKVTAQLERVVAQTVIPSSERPYPLYYAPTVAVYANRKIVDADQLKMFEVYPAEGQTISLHIYARTFEIGITVKGLGNVLITRGPFVLDIGTFVEPLQGVFFKPTLELRDTIRDIGMLTADEVSGTFYKPVVELKSTERDIGTLTPETLAGTFYKPVVEILEVLVDVSALVTVPNDATTGTFYKPTIELVIP